MTAYPFIFQADNITVLWGYNSEHENGDVFGPKAGGTLIVLYSKTVDLENLFDPSNVNLVLTHNDAPNDLICEPSEHTPSSDKYWTCLTPALGDSGLLGKMMKIQMKCDNDHYFLNKNFIYKPNPQLDDDQNLYSIQQGGIKYSVRGQNMMSVGFPVINIYVEYKNELQPQCFHCINLCSIDTPDKFTCISHEMYENVLPIQIVKDELRSNRKKREEMQPIGFRFKNSNLNDVSSLSGYISSLYQYAYNVRNATHASFVMSKKLKNTNHYLTTYNSQDSFEKKVYIVAQFSLDGTETEQYTFLIFKNPTLNGFQDRPRDFKPQWPDNEEILKISGRNLRRGASAVDYEVKVGNEDCPILDIDDSAISCKPPKEKPNTEGTPTLQGGAQVKVTVGFLPVTVGYLRYRYWYQSTLFIGIVLAVALVPVVAIGGYCLWRCILKKGKGQYWSHDKVTVVPNHYDRDVLDKLEPALKQEIQDSGLLLPQTKELKMGMKIGEGHFGTVYEGWMSVGEVLKILRHADYKCTLG